MRGVWCEDCGETRWSPSRPIDELLGPCLLCGGRTHPERRRPGLRPRRLEVERREARFAPGEAQRREQASP